MVFPFHIRLIGMVNDCKGQGDEWDDGDQISDIRYQGLGMDVSLDLAIARLIFGGAESMRIKNRKLRGELPIYALTK